MSRIKHLIKQLFFRISLQNYRNWKYKGRKDKTTVNRSKFQEGSPSLNKCQDIER